MGAAFVSINENCQDESFHQLLSGLHLEIDNVIMRMSSVFMQRKEQLIFAINNYDVILSVIGVSHVIFKSPTIILIQLFCVINVGKEQWRLERFRRF
jgi:hypothetical protein